jgi:hypothetical protein
VHPFHAGPSARRAERNVPITRFGHKERGPINDHPDRSPHAGRIGPSAVTQNPDGNRTMLFAGYSTAKPLPSVGTVLGTNAPARFTVAANRPALYRTIPGVTLRLSANGI